VTRLPVSKARSQADSHDQIFLLTEEYKRLIRPTQPDDVVARVRESSFKMTKNFSDTDAVDTNPVDTRLKLNGITGNGSFATRSEAGGDVGNEEIEIATEADNQDEFDVFELPIDTDVKGDAELPAAPDEGLLDQSTAYTSASDASFPQISPPLDEHRTDAPTSSARDRNSTHIAESNNWPKPPATTRKLTAPTVTTTVNGSATDSSSGPVSEGRSFRPTSKSAHRTSSGNRTFGERTFNKKNSWGRRNRDSGEEANSRLNKEPGDSNPKQGRRIFGSATEARRQRKGRGVTAAATAIVGQPEQKKRTNSLALLQSAIAQNSDIKPLDIRSRDEAYRKVPTRLPASWSSKLVDCQTRDQQGHRVMFLWNEADLSLFIYDTATNSIKGAEIESEYAEWELLPSSFLHLVQSGSRQRLIGRVWPFSRTKR